LTRNVIEAAFTTSKQQSIFYVSAWPKLERQANLSWSRTRAKFCRLVANLFVFVSFFSALKIKLKDSSLSFVSLCWSRITDKLVINWQNFSRVRL